MTLDPEEPIIPPDQRELSPGTSVIVDVPATSANVGPGFDCFGLALDWRQRVNMAVIDHGYQIEVAGEGATELPRDESHLIIRSALVGLADLGVRAPGLWLGCRNTIPHGKGLGSSSAAIVAGLMAAAGLAEVHVEPEWLLRHANAIEGHPDNVAAAIYGGFVLAYEGRGGVTAAQARVHPAIRAALFIPGTSLATEAARGLLPEVVPHVDAAANSARAALLVHAVASEPNLLYDATCDWLHQGYRGAAMPRSYELMKSLRGHGYAAMISGAGPSVLVLGVGADLAALQDHKAPGFSLRLSHIGSAAAIIDPSYAAEGGDQTVMETPSAGASLREPTRSGQLR
ncbi:MAG TPA: homoserine kinase [Propionibacteriaceae bacterium]|nr:homoserine kinase [Propionibacteriaceae bacterium]